MHASEVSADLYARAQQHQHDAEALEGEQGELAIALAHEARLLAHQALKLAHELDYGALLVHREFCPALARLEAPCCCGCAARTTPESDAERQWQELHDRLEEQLPTSSLEGCERYSRAS